MAGSEGALYIIHRFISSICLTNGVECEEIYILHLKVKEVIFFWRTNFLSGWIEKCYLCEVREKKLLFPWSQRECNVEWQTPKMHHFMLLHGMDLSLLTRPNPVLRCNSPIPLQCYLLTCKRLTSTYSWPFCCPPSLLDIDCSADAMLVVLYRIFGSTKFIKWAGTDSVSCEWMFQVVGQMTILRGIGSRGSNWVCLLWTLFFEKCY